MEFLRDPLNQYVITTVLTIVGIILTIIGFFRSNEKKTETIVHKSPMYPQGYVTTVRRGNSGGAIVTLVLGVLIIFSSLVCFFAAQTVYGFVANITSSISYGFNTSPFGNNPDSVLKTFCSNMQSHSFDNAYSQYSREYKKKVSAATFTQTWTDVSWDSCVGDNVEATGNTVTTSLTVRDFFTKKIQTYKVILVKEDGKTWKIDDIS